MFSSEPDVVLGEVEVFVNRVVLEHPVKNVALMVHLEDEVLVLN